MKFTIKLRKEAESEIRDAFEWYESHLVGLGHEFLLSIDESLAILKSEPEIYPLVHSEIRRALLKKFPFGVFYTINAENIIVLAVFHAKRNPDAWKTRK
ncbi:MAG: type II toxin-antitoxin system RelE/ParE family toxin [Bdellovibrionota bacterium]